AAAAAGLDGDEALAVAHDPDWKDRIMAGFAHTRDDGAFGVPLFIYRGERFWGNDRLDWLLREVARSEGREVSDLASDPLAPVYSA
ncbi:MAG: DsbA family protein, partial [Acidobacteria bacterium]|nr:DsbA family protein [Acidobacteriota bacterium]